jgi:holo-[acyl-carrier protein] synthase
MILGLGSDTIDIRRIERSIDRYGERFLERIFTGVERRKSDQRRMRAASYAKRFAAKEACAKALGTGLADGVFWRDMGVVNLQSGKPTMELTGGAAERAYGADRRVDNRRFPAGASHRDHFGGAGIINLSLFICACPVAGLFALACWRRGATKAAWLLRPGTDWDEQRSW